MEPNKYIGKTLQATTNTAVKRSIAASPCLRYNLTLLRNSNRILPHALLILLIVSFAGTQCYCFSATLDANSLLFDTPVFVNPSRLASQRATNLQTIGRQQQQQQHVGESDGYNKRRRHDYSYAEQQLETAANVKATDYHPFVIKEKKRLSRFSRQASGTHVIEQRPSLADENDFRLGGLTQNDRDTFYTDVAVGDELSITCVGNRPIRWRYPQQQQNGDRRVQIDDSGWHRPSSPGSGGVRLKQSTLTVRAARAGDTGMYQCVYADNDDDNDINNNVAIGSSDKDDADGNVDRRVNVFIFVNDWQKLLVQPKNFLPRQGAMITLSQGEPGVIPCVPTFSNATVTLYNVHHVGHEVEIPLSLDESGDFRYAPTRGGIIVPFPSKPMVGQYRCVARVDRAPNYDMRIGSKPYATEDLNVRALNFIAQTKPPYPVIDRSQARHVIEGGSFSLSCYVNLPPTKEPIKLEWTAPSSDAQRRMRITPTMDVTRRSGALDYEYLEVRRNFTLASVDLIADAGPYECHIQKGGQTRRAAVDIQPFPAHEKSHIYIRPENPVEVLNFTTPVETLPPGRGGDLASSTKFLAKYVVFRAALDVYPEPPHSVYWMRNGQRIKLRDEKYNLTQLVNNEYAFLRINDIDSVDDAGIYTLWVETNDRRQSADFQLIIHVVPVVQLLGATDARAAYVKETRDEYNVVLHAAEQDHVLTCRANGNPIPEVHWRWQECPSQESCNPSSRSNWHDMKPQAYKNVADFVTLTAVSNLTIRATRPTWYQCRARNGVAASSDGYMTSDVLSVPSDIFSRKQHHQQLRVTPIDDQFDMLPDMPIEGDDVTLTCRGSKVLFQRLVVQHFAPGINEARVRRQQLDTPYSHVESITIDNIGRNDGGFYECYLYPATWLLDSREPKKRRLEMSIDEQTMPYIHRFEPADHTVNAVYSRRQDLQCIAHARPPAQYEWLKDGQPLERHGDDAHRYEDGGQVLVLPRVVEEDGGLYECVARNRVGEARHDWTLAVTGDPTGTTTMSAERRNLVIFISIFVGIGFLIMLTCLAYACTKWRKERRLRKRLQHLERLLKTKGDLERLDPTVPLSHQAELLEFKEQFEFPREKLRLLEVLLGSGKFGKVVSGEAQGIAAFSMAADGGKKPAKNNSNTNNSVQQLQQRWIRVAVKVPRDHGNVEQLQMLMAELKVHMFVGHHLNVVNLLGAVTKNFQLGEMFVILEYCGNGSLKKFLLRHRREENFLNHITPSGDLYKLDPEVLEAKRLVLAASLLSDADGGRPNLEGTVLTSSDLISFAFQMACGMAYLADKRVIHRDLAARNVLVTDNLVIKIADFGLAREGENKEEDGDAEYSRSLLKEYNNEPLPVKWVAPECVSESRFSTASDVWSYGITLWEIFSLGGDPYPDDKPSREFLDKIFAGYRMQRPAFAPRQMYTIMQLCWDIDPQQRPNFVQLQQLVSRMMNDAELDKYQSLSTLEPYQYMHLMAASSASNGGDEAWPLLPAHITSNDDAARRFVELTPEDSSTAAEAGGAYRRKNHDDDDDVDYGDDSGVGGTRRSSAQTRSPPATASTYADTSYRAGTSITSAGSTIPGSNNNRRTPGAFTYLPSPTSSTTSRPYLAGSIMSRFTGRNTAPALSGSSSTATRPSGLLETDLDGSTDAMEMDTIVSRNNIGRASTRPLLPPAGDDGYLNEQFSPAAMSPVFRGGVSPSNSSFIANSNSNGNDRDRTTSPFKLPPADSVSSSTTKTITVPALTTRHRVSSPNRRK